MAAEERDPNRDPLADETQSHPVGTGVGAAGGAVAGTAAGMAGGPLGMAVGGVVGAVVGGVAGRAAAQAINPSDEEAHWRDRYTSEPYYEPGRSFEDYGPAYRYGLESRQRHEDDWDTAASRLEAGWDQARGGSALNWQQAQPASRAAWDRAGQPRTEVIDLLNDLVECCKDGEYGFRACADNARREDLRSIFQQRAEDCQRGARELQDQIRALGGEAEDSGSALGAVHRGWVSVKSTLATHDDKAMLEEAERGEDNALARYRKALQKPLPDAVRTLVEQQLQGVQRNHDQIRMLRDQFRAAG